MRKTILLLLLLSPFFLVNTVYASDVNLLEIPEALADRLGISTFAGGIIATAILLMIFILPTALISRKKNTGFIAELVMGFVGLGIAVAIGWCPYWVLFMIGLFVALMFAGAMRSWITGGGKE